VIAGVVLLPPWMGDRHLNTASNRGCAILYMIWSTLVWASACLAVTKGRESVEGAVLGAVSTLGFIMEVLLPPSTVP
jgi:hypothetical protein